MNSALFRPAPGHVARVQLARAFPHVPSRIIVAVLDAYRTVTPNRPAAVAGAQARLADACIAA